MWTYYPITLTSLWNPRNGEDNIVEFEMIARAMAVTIDLCNEHLIRFIRDGKVVTEMNRDSTPSNIAEVLPSSAPFHVRPPNVFRDFRAEPWINVSGKRPLLFSSRGRHERQSASLRVHNSGFIMTEPHERFSVIGFQRKRCDILTDRLSRGFCAFSPVG